jgi:hypothetical protein
MSQKPSLEDLRERLHGKIKSKRNNRFNSFAMDSNADKKHKDLIENLKFNEMDKLSVSKIIDAMNFLKSGKANASEANEIVSNIMGDVANISIESQQNCKNLLMEIYNDHDILKSFINKLFPFEIPQQTIEEKVLTKNQKKNKKRRMKEKNSKLNGGGSRIKFQTNPVM